MAAVNALAVPSTSVALRDAPTVGVPAPAAPASTTAPVDVPRITAASLVPAMFTVSTCRVPSAVATVMLSV